VIAMIGKLPPTLSSRGIHIKLKRMLPGEPLEALKSTSHLEVLQRKCIRWASDHAEELIGANPVMPVSLYGRAADNWGPLLAIAESIGGDWTERARDVAVVASGRYSDELASIQILHDVAAIFGARGVDRLSSEEIVIELAEMEGRPWPEWGRQQKPITKNQLAKLLDAHNIVPTSVRMPTGKTPKGYHLRAFTDELTRYPPSQTATPPQALPDKELRVFFKTQQRVNWRGQKSQNSNGCGGVAAQEPEQGGVERENDDGDPFAGLRDASLLPDKD
jgi:putative DNA primase/helicase